jgi:type I restriction enzyme S subunit
MSLPRYPTYKDSGVAWLGKVPGHWEVTPLKYSVDVRLSNIDKHTVEDEPSVLLCNYTDVYKNERIVSSIEFMAATASPEQIRRLSLEVDDIIITKDSEDPRDIGVPAHVTEVLPNLVCGYHLALLRPREGINGGYIYHLFKSRYVAVAFETEATGMTRYALGKYSIENLGIPLPSPEEQSAIAAFLDRETGKIDALVAEQEKLIQLLSEKRQAVISHAVTKGINPAVSMKDSGIEWLGEVPEHWEVKRLKYVGKAIGGLTYDPSEIVEEGSGMLVLRSSNVQNGRIVFDDNVYVTTAIPEKIITQNGDILVCSRNGSRALIGKNAMIDSESSGVTFGAFMMIFRSEYSGYIFHVFNSQLFKFQSGAFLTATINQLTVGNLYSMEVPLPPVDEQHTIKAFLNRENAQFNALILEANRGIELLKERRSALISAAVTGKIDVRATPLLEAA